MLKLSSKTTFAFTLLLLICRALSGNISFAEGRDHPKVRNQNICGFDTKRIYFLGQKVSSTGNLKQIIACAEVEVSEF